MTTAAVRGTVPVKPRPQHRRAAAYVFLAAVFVISTAYQTGVTGDVLHGIRVEVPYFALHVGTAEVEGVRASAAEAGVRKGDTLLSVNGRSYTGTAVLAQEEVKAVPGQSIALVFRTPDGRERNVELPVTRTPINTSDTAVAVLLLVAAPIICILLGCWVVLVRPYDKLAWLLLGMLLSFAQLFGSVTIEAWHPILRELALVYHIGLAGMFPVFMFAFGFYFPEPFPEGTRIYKWAKPAAWVLLVPLTFAALSDGVFVAAQATNYAVAGPLRFIADPFDHVIQAFAYAAVSCFFIFISMKSAKNSPLPQDARRRLRLLYWGATGAMTPTLLLVIAAAVMRTSLELLPKWITYPAFFLLLLFPLTLAYVIVVQRAMDVRVVLRQGLQYALAKNGIRGMQFIVTGLVVIGAFMLATEPNRGQAEKLVAISLGVTAIFTIRRGAEKLRSWTDRHFFREAYDIEQVLSDLGDHVRSIVETRPLIQTVAERISDTLHIPRIAVLLGTGASYRPAYALGFATVPDVSFPPTAGTVRLLQEAKEPERVYFDDPESWIYREPNVAEEERTKLAQLDSELLLPLNARDKLLGFISLGRKRSDEPYSGTDVRLLKSVAAQTGLALENARLMSAIADEVAQRERLNREVEIAREVQERLFPQKLPPIAGIDYAGACRPALGVGGDYYDFLALPGGQLGIAIGDVSGKGIAAALMMASLQASLRGEATRAPENLAALVSNVNRLVYEASSANRYATFFYGQYNPANRALTYVNAGHNPPMLFHKESKCRRVSRLETGGTVVGLLENFPYQQDSILLAPGDVFIAFTDGISEAMNSADEEWGEAQLIETVEHCAALCPSEMITRIMQAADAFVAGAKQHDDMTLVVLRAHPERL